MPRKATYLSDTFKSHLNYLGQSQRKAESLFTERILVERDLDLLYAGIFLDAVTSFERLIEDLFVGLLTERYTTEYKRIKPKVVLRSTATCHGVLSGSRSYVDWLPYNMHTPKRAKRFFDRGDPFTKLEKVEVKRIEKISIIRNAIAHKSKHSMARFSRDVIGTLPLRKREKTPIGYLRSIYQSNPVTRRYDELAFEMARVATLLCKGKLCNGYLAL